MWSSRAVAVTLAATVLAGAPAAHALSCTTASQCNDANPCTADLCMGGTCVNDALAMLGASCSDGDACTSPDVCGFVGDCVPGFPIDCADGDPCTSDLCSPATGCTHPFNTAPCGAGDPCVNASFCLAGACLASGPLDCDDGDPCTADACLSGVGCQHDALGALGVSCDDGDACTFPDVCGFAGDCVPGFPIDCADGDPCTDDDCSPATGCQHPHNTAPCGATDPCVDAGFCSAGACVPTGPLDCDDGNPCTVDACVAFTGCTHDALGALGAACDDGNVCTVPDVCGFAGDCVPGFPIDCEDGNPCTDDPCNPATGCAHLNNAAPCGGNPCVVASFCSGGTCVSTGAPLDCNDDDPCTADACVAGVGCAYDPLGALGVACDDGDACTFPDICGFAGDCVPGFPIDCDDGVVCTDDLCDPASGCAHPTSTGPCDDGTPCSAPAACVGGVCTPVAPPTCDDGNPCTVDLCVDPVGCQHDALAALGSPCDDGEPCTVPDVCGFAGDCVPGLVFLDCDDGSPCTLDVCGPGGCTYEPADWGDLNASGFTNVIDVQCAILASLASLGGLPTPGCVAIDPADIDVNCDGGLNVTDVLLIIGRALDQLLSTGVDADQNGCVDACEAP